MIYQGRSVAEATGCSRGRATAILRFVDCITQTSVLTAQYLALRSGTSGNESGVSELLFENNPMAANNSNISAENQHALPGFTTDVYLKIYSTTLSNALPHSGTRATKVRPPPRSPVRCRTYYSNSDYAQTHIRTLSPAFALACSCAKV